MNSHKEITQTLEQAFRSIRDVVLAHAGNVQSETKQDGTPQTQIDIDAERAIGSSLAIAHPELTFFGEESGYSEDLPNFCCLIDALDGTKSYIKNEPAFTGMAVLIEDGYAVASLIYNYTTDEIFTAFRGIGAYKNGVKLDISQTEMPKTAFCRERMVEDVNKLLVEKESSIICESGPSGAGYGFSLVADGKLAARFNFPHFPGGGHIHDYAPGALLVEEAGGVLINIEQTSDYSIHTKSFVACHPQIAPVLSGLRNQIQHIAIVTAS